MISPLSLYFSYNRKVCMHQSTNAKKHNFNQKFTISICKPEIKQKISPLSCPRFNGMWLIHDNSGHALVKLSMWIFQRRKEAFIQRLLCRAVDEDRKIFDYFLRTLWGEFCCRSQTLQLDKLIWYDALEWENYKHWHRTTFNFLTFSYRKHCFCSRFIRTLLSLVAKKSKALWIARSTFEPLILPMEGDKSGVWILNFVLIDSMSVDQSEDSVHRRTRRNCATQVGLVFGQGGFFSRLPAPFPSLALLPTTRPRPSRANPRWRPHYEFRLFRSSNRLRAGYPKY